ncbi:MAG TPA: phospholipase [Faecalibacterium sp.]|nr:phospholipase [Faecalibacterium sp.]
MERRDPTQKALVLAGGGARGSYQVGVWRALMELDWHPQIITGTSVGGLNGAMFVLDLYETARDMWLTIRSRDVMELPEENADFSALHQFLRRVVKEGGMDVTPLEEIVERVLDEDALRAAPIRFGIVTVEQRGLRPRELTLEDIPAGQVRDYLMASAACFPALRARQIDGVKFLDGGYSDNMPTGLAKTMGAEELVCVDLEGVGITRPNLTGLPTTMIRSYWELGDILHFDPDTAKRNMELGYYDTRRAMGYLRGCAYAVSCDAQSCEDAAAFDWKFTRLQKAVREKYPVTLTADVALKLANMTKDAQLAPLEAAAEDAGVDPTRFYTTRTLAEAFLAACDKDRMESFAPLFTGSSTAGQAALAALLPNTFLQALVWRTLTASALPEVTEDEGL